MIQFIMAFRLVTLAFQKCGDGWDFLSWYKMDVMQSYSLASKYFLTSNLVVTPLGAKVALPGLATTLFELQNVIYNFKKF